jgi:hypothetical protein
MKNKLSQSESQKQFYLSLLTTAIKDKNFLQNKDIFNNLMTQSNIDINEKLQLNKNDYTNFIYYTLDSYEKFKYLVQNHNANYHISRENKRGDWINISSLSTQLLKEVIEKETKNKHANILNYIKESPYTWLEKEKVQHIRDEQLLEFEDSFFVLYFNIYSDKKEELEKVLKFKFTKNNEQIKFDQEKEKLFFNLLYASIMVNSSNTNLIQYRMRGNKLEHLKNYLPILLKDESFSPSQIELEKMVALMVAKHHKIGQYKENSLEIVSFLIKNNLYTLEQFKKINFQEKFVDQFILHINDKLKEDEKYKSKCPYGYDVFYSLLNSLDKLSEMKIPSYITPNQKKEIFKIIRKIEKTPEDIVDIFNEKSIDRKNQKQQFKIIKELIQCYNETEINTEKTHRLKI